MTSAPCIESATTARSAWRLDWLSPRRCRLIFFLLLAFGVLSHLYYLHNNCPIDLSGDEAQYWDWSRQLDWSYYSKGPLVAYIIRASCALFDDTMPAVRYPAIALGAMTLIVTYLLTRKLFGSDRLALGTVLLFHIVPMFIAGSVIMTIDPPMFFCWALATCLLAFAVFDRKQWAWPLIGIVIGVGFLAKYSTLLWFVGVFGFLWFTRRRREIRFMCLALGVALLFTIPVIVWNAHNGWVSFLHVARQTGAARSMSIQPLGALEMIGGQIGVVGPTICVLMIAGIFWSLRGSADPNREKLLMLAWIGLSFFAANLLISILTKVQPNWPAPAYFTLLILTAYFIGTRLGSIQTWKPWRGWFWASMLIGIAFIPIAHDTARIYFIFEPLSKLMDREIGELDPLARLRGWEQLGHYVSQEKARLGPDAFVLCDDYQQTAAMAFYVSGQPKTYCAGSYYGKRLSQYDIWADRRIDPASPLVGRDAIYVGKGGSLPPELISAFEEVEKLPELPIMVRGTTARTFKLWRCRGFKGMRRGAEAVEY